MSKHFENMIGKVTYPFEAKDRNYLSLRVHEKVHILKEHSGLYWYGTSVKTKKSGIFPKENIVVLNKRKHLRRQTTKKRKEKEKHRKRHSTKGSSERVSKSKKNQLKDSNVKLENPKPPEQMKPPKIEEENPYDDNFGGDDLFKDISSSRNKVMEDLGLEDFDFDLTDEENEEDKITKSESSNMSTFDEIDGSENKSEEEEEEEEEEEYKDVELRDDDLLETMRSLDPDEMIIDRSEFDKLFREYEKVRSQVDHLKFENQKLMKSMNPKNLSNYSSSKPTSNSNSPVRNNSLKISILKKKINSLKSENSKLKKNLKNLSEKGYSPEKIDDQKRLNKLLTSERDQARKQLHIVSNRLKSKETSSKQDFLKLQESERKWKLKSYDLQNEKKNISEIMKFENEKLKRIIRQFENEVEQFETEKLKLEKMKVENQNLKKLSGNQISNKNKDKKLGFLQSENSKLKKNMEKIKEQYSKKEENQLKSFESKIDSKNSEIANLKDSLETLSKLSEKNMENTSLEIKQLEKSKTKVEEDYKELNSNFMELKKKSDRSKSSLKEEKKKSEIQKSKLKALNLQLENLKKTNLENMKIKEESSNLSLSETSKKLQTLESQITSKSSEIAILQEKIENLEISILSKNEEIQSTGKMVVSLNEKISNQNDIIVENSEKIENLETTVNEKNEEIKKSEETVNSISSKLSELSKTDLEKSGKIEELETKNSENLEKMGSLNTTLSDVQGEIGELKAVISTNKRTIDSLTTENSEMSSKIVELKSTISSNSSMSTKITEKLETEESRVSELQRKYDVSKESEIQKSRTIEKQASEFASLEAKFSQFKESKNLEFSKTLKIHEEFKKLVEETKNSEIRKTENIISEFKNQVIQKNQKISDLQNTIQKLEMIKNQKSEIIETLETSKKSMTSEISEKLENIEILKEDLNQLKNKKKLLESSFSGEQKKVEDLENRNLEFSKNIEFQNSKVSELSKTIENLKTTHQSSLSSQKQNLEKEFKDKRSVLKKKTKIAIQKLQAQNIRIKKEYESFKVQKKNEFEELKKSISKKLENKKKEIQNFKNSVIPELKKDVVSNLEFFQTEVISEFLFKKSLYPLISKFDEINKSYKKEFSLRKKIFNELQDMKGKIRVFIRPRPLLSIDGNDAISIFVNLDKNMISLIPDSKQNDERSSRKVKKKVQKFEFDETFMMDSSQEAVFEKVKDLSVSVLDGYNVTVFAYGQTGSGKTYSMEGTTSNPGINIKVVNEIFEIIQNSRSSTWSYKIGVAISEIYVNKIYDLLSSKREQRKILMSGNRIKIENLTKIPVSSSSVLLKLLEKAKSIRSTASTNMNEHSSRSHCIVSLFIMGTNKITKSVCKGKLNLIDLAGSENIKKSLENREYDTGDENEYLRIQEATSINASLMSLGTVMSSIHKKEKHIPYRNSALTSYLKDSLGGNSKVLMCCCISPSVSSFEETSRSLSFANRIKTITLGKVKRNIQ